MCGLVGFISKKYFNDLSQDLSEASSCLSHRGPNDSGFFYDEKIGLGLAHRRLSIIDRSSAGHQPMTSNDVTIIYNGEIYNFRNIRKTLEGYGHKFKSNTDTEVVLKAYIQWGIDCLEKFIGMFAFAIWDGRKKRLFLARDRIGIKPLYYHFSDGIFLFASELKAFMALSVFKKDIDPDSIPLFLHYQYIPTPRTVFKNTFKLLPGHFLTYENNTIKTHTYWRYPDMKVELSDSALNEEEKLQQLDDILTQAVSDRMISDVPLGALLSGGIDSSIVVALMQKVNSSPVRTFSIGFKEKKYNEAKWAAKVARHLGTDHTELYVTPKEAIDVIPMLPKIYDEPFADSSAIPTFLVSKLTRSHVTVALSGDGGDEQFSGYVRYWSTRSAVKGLRYVPVPVRRFISDLLKSIPLNWIESCYLPLRNVLPQPFRVANFPDKWQKLTGMISQTLISELYRMTICYWSKEELLSLIGKQLPESQFENTFKETEGWQTISRLMMVDQKTYLPDAMLTKVDRASMAASLEVRVPLLDHRVVEYTASLPENLKYRNGTGKYILKKLLAKYVPGELFERPKMGFGVPIGHWLRKELKDLLLDYLSPERLKKEGLFDHVIVERKIKEHMSGRINLQYQLWALLMWEMWREQWLY
ncbi:MAG: asparagine synthase (glutamine-hydrolyzing) [Desulfobacterales bacterium]|nr:asparagine synthase (glutamine-hydrolyzing) [Desulfobacterales bacterium]